MPIITGVAGRQPNHRFPGGLPETYCGPENVGLYAIGITLDTDGTRAFPTNERDALRSVSWEEAFDRQYPDMTGGIRE